MDLTNPKPGIYEGISFDDYKAIDAINASTVKHAQKSLKHVKHYLDNPTKPTRSMMFGRPTHTALFEPDIFNDQYAVFDGKVRRGKEWIEFAEANASKEILKKQEAHAAIFAAETLRQDGGVCELLEEGAPEVVVLHEEHNGLCKGRIDWLRDDAIVDLKTTMDIKPGKFARQCADYGYHIQFGLYRRWLMEQDGKLRDVILIVQENKAPYDFYVVMMAHGDLTAGENLGMQYIADIRGAQASGVWPGYAAKMDFVLSLPHWAVGNMDEPLTLKIGGEEVAL